MKTALLSAVVISLCLIGPVSAQDADERTFFVKVAKGTELSGEVVGVTDLKVKTGFGDVSIPVSKIEGIKMDSDGQGSAVIAFTNGDMVTGKIDMSELILKTVWGKAHINTDAIESISASQFGRFYSDPSGGGWRFSRGGANRNTSTLGGAGGQVINGR